MGVGQTCGRRSECVVMLRYTSMAHINIQPRASHTCARFRSCIIGGNRGSQVHGSAHAAQHYLKFSSQLSNHCDGRTCARCLLQQAIARTLSQVQHADPCKRFLLLPSSSVCPAGRTCVGGWERGGVVTLRAMLATHACNPCLQPRCISGRLSLTEGTLSQPCAIGIPSMKAAI